MSHAVLLVVNSLAWPSYCAWSLPAIVCRWQRILGRRQSRVLVTMRNELRPFAPVLLLVTLATNFALGELSAFDLAGDGGHIFVWLVYRKDGGDDDRWKRRKAKMTARVAELGGRLQVVPAGAR